MRWKQVLGSPWASATGLVVGAPGLLDDFSFWQRAFGDMNAGLQGALIGGGGAVLAISTLVLIEHRWAAIRANAEVFAVVAIAVLALGFLGGIGYAISLIDFSRPAKVWVHPDNDAPAAALGDCETRAYDAIGGKPLGGNARRAYVRSCMASKGFELRLADDG